MLFQLLVVLLCIIIGARLGGMGLGVMGGLGVALLTFVFGLQPTSPPVDVMLMIAAVISAAASMQAAGGLDYMVKVAERLLRKHPQYITILAPLVTYTFTFLAGTGHVAYSVLPVIAEVARETKIRPERPLGIAVIASQQAITASPISAATVALLGLLAGFDITLFDILKISVPATLVGVLVGAFASMRVGKELVDDPEYKRRVEEGVITNETAQTGGEFSKKRAVASVSLFLAATLMIVLFGSIESLRPAFDGVTVGMPLIIEMVMLATAALILLLTKTDGAKAVQGSVFSAGMQAVVAIFGIAWMGDTFINGNIVELKGAVAVLGGPEAPLHPATWPLVFRLRSQKWAKPSKSGQRHQFSSWGWMTEPGVDQTPPLTLEDADPVITGRAVQPPPGRDTADCSHH